MSMAWIEKVTGSLEQKKQYRQLQARLKALPEPHRAAAAAVKRYLLYAGGVPDADSMMAMFTDFTELWEEAVAEGTSVRDVVGADPVAFADAFAAAYSGKKWIDKERNRLPKAIDELDGGAS